MGYAVAGRGHGRSRSMTVTKLFEEDRDEEEAPWRAPKLIFGASTATCGCTYLPQPPPPNLYESQIVTISAATLVECTNYHGQL
ncbi:hypothetical protein EVG20_g4632 [Dentipellis fragilis]|uniref:Uncharacterized protein n=1 Tax=Dentipellis fragilis TaxID=205917 RepID=A0A4Y9YY05_9AGAM|nr:hypothetical protein EVG20_g4632 [Dentipellis fragilis]